MEIVDTVCKSKFKKHLLKQSRILDVCIQCTTVLVTGPSVMFEDLT